MFAHLRHFSHAVHNYHNYTHNYHHYTGACVNSPFQNICTGSALWTLLVVSLMVRTTWCQHASYTCTFCTSTTKLVSRNQTLKEGLENFTVQPRVDLPQIIVAL